MADCGIGGVVSGGITVRCRHIHTTAHGESDAFCLVVLILRQGELAGRPDVKHHALRDQGLVQRHGHFCVVRYIVGLFAGGLVSSNSQGIGHILVTVFHGNNAAGHGQRVADCGSGGVVSGGITVLCRHIHTTAHAESDALSLVVLTCEQGEIAGGRPTVKHFAIGHCGLVQRHGHCCALRYIVGLLAGGCARSNSQSIGHIAAVVFHSNSAAGHGQLVAVQSIGVELPTGIEGDVIRNCGIFHIKELAIFELAIFGVPAGELVTRTFGSIDGIQIGFLQIVCLGISDFFGLINRHLSVVCQVIGQVVGQVAALAGQVAAIGIKGHLAEVKKIVSCQYIVLQYNIVVTQSICGGLVVLVVDDTFRPTIFQTVIESSQSSREYNVFQFGAICKGLRVNGFYIFRDGDGLEF